MNFKEYQEKVNQMPLYDQPELGLVGEVGGVIELIKKDRRLGTKRQILSKEDLTKELGDVLWYLTRLSSVYFIDLEEVEETNIKKLNKRHGIVE